MVKIFQQNFAKIFSKRNLNIFRSKMPVSLQLFINPYRLNM
jgi:hypothetical protein